MADALSATVITGATALPPAGPENSPSDTTLTVLATTTLATLAISHFLVLMALTYRRTGTPNPDQAQ